MKICIHRGANEIGGTCIEVESQGRRLVLDIGMPLDCPNAESADMPTVPGLERVDDSLLGIVLSHPHLDHYGLAFRVPSGRTTFLMGEATERILAAAAVFTPSGGTFDHVLHLSDRRMLDLGPFRITPFLIDHSAYDSYALLVEGDGKRIFYTGDFRGHGRKSKLFDRLVTNPPNDIDLLLMEGTTITRTGGNEGCPTEADLEKQLIEIFRATNGLPLVWCSGQNIDRLVTVYKAAKKSSRQFIIDMYTAHILRATGNPKIPQADWDGVRIFLPKFQKQRIKRNRDFPVANLYRDFRIFPEELAEVSNKSVMLFRPSMQIDVESAGCLDGACLVYSMWDGYLEDNKMKPFLSWLNKCGIPMHKCHTSGHATVKDLQRLREAFGDAVVCPVHTIAPMEFLHLFNNVKVLRDGEIFDII